jgi:hypothetical protein
MTDIQILILALLIGFWWLGRKISGLSISVSTPDPAKSIKDGMENLGENLSSEIKALRFAVERSVERRPK